MGDKKSTNTKAGAGDRSNNQTNKATEAVKKAVGFTEKKSGPFDYLQKGKTTDSFTIKDGKINEMYGGQVSMETNKYLEDIGEAKKGSQNPDGSYNYLLTSKGWKMKYGSYTAGQTQTGSAMGSGQGGVMGNIPISKKMFERQNKIKAVMLGGLSLIAGPIVGTPMRMAAADALNAKYGDYRKSFTANLAMGNTQSTASKENTETANLGFGTTETEVVNNKKSKKSKDTTKYFAGIGQDESTMKRTFYT